jgi:hypothetical protein
MQYPDSIQPYVYPFTYPRGFSKACEHDLHRKGVGAFAFYVVYDEKAHQRNQQSFDRAMARNPFRDRYEANKILDRAHRVGFAMVLNGGIIHHLVLSCNKIKQNAKTKDDLVKHLIQQGLPIDPQKLCDVAEMYRAAITI